VTLLLALKVSIAVLLLAIGMGSSLQDVTYLWRRPQLLLKSLLAMYVLVPAAAIGMVATLDLPGGTGAALLVLGICAGAPLLSRKLMKAELDSDFVFSLVVTTSLLAVVTVPVSLRWLQRYLSFEAAGDPGPIARLIVASFLAPLIAGMAVRAVAPKWADRVDDLLIRIAGLVLLACTVALLVRGRGLLLELGWPSLGAFAAFVAVSLAVGHLLGGPSAIGRTSLALACGSRHVGLALLVAANANNARALTLVAGYLVASALVSIPYMSWRRRVHAESTARP
jgi:predicted Na+-dependent transporter